MSDEKTAALPQHIQEFNTIVGLAFAQLCFDGCARAIADRPSPSPRSLPACEPALAIRAPFAAPGCRSGSRVLFFCLRSSFHCCIPILSSRMGDRTNTSGLNTSRCLASIAAGESRGLIKSVLSPVASTHPRKSLCGLWRVGRGILGVAATLPKMLLMAVPYRGTECIVVCKE
jgi:hypothetical protein